MLTRGKVLKETQVVFKMEMERTGQSTVGIPMDVQDPQPDVVGKGENGLEKNQDMLILKVFGNDLLWDKIAEYLNPADLRSACLTNKLFMGKIRSQKSFVDRRKLIICRESFKKKVLSRTRFKWKKGDIELSTLPSKALPSIRRVLQSIQDLELYEAYGVSETDRHYFLQEIIHNTPYLTSLTIDCSLIERLNGTLLSEPKIHNVLKGLQELRLVTGRFEDARMISCSDGVRSTFPQNILKLAAIPMKLRSFVFQKIDTYYGNQKDHVAYVPQLVEKNCKTLEELTLQLHVWSLDAMKTIVCPALKKLSITAYRRNDLIVKTFIQNQPLLESMCVQFKNGFPLSVLRAIITQGSRLRKLHLKAASFTDSPDLIDWTFLLNCTRLKDFSIFQPRAFIGQNETQGTCSQYLNSLPDGVRKIALRGLEHGWAGSITTNTIACLERFKNITDLSLMRCEQTINDEILQFICSNLTKLQVLQFSHSQHLTDYGLTGVPEVGSDLPATGVSMKNLKGLRQLTMRECKQITEAGLLASIEFLELMKLDIAVRGIPISRATLIRLVQQNPSLEAMTTHFPGDEAVSDEVKAVLKNSSARYNNTFFVQDDWALEDSDSDAEEFDEEFESSDDGSFDSWDWDSEFDDDDDLILQFHGQYSDYSDQDDYF